MDAKLVLDENYYYLEVQHERIGKMVVGSSDHELSRIVNQPFKLSTKNCEAIKNGYDLDDLASSLVDRETNASVDSSYRKTLEKYVKIGFQKALEILGDKKFSEEQLRRGISEGFSNARWHGQTSNEIFQSLQQTEFEVEICCYIGNGDKESDSFNDPLVTNTGIPKLDEDGCLILRRK